MINYDDLMQRILLKSNNEEQTNNVIEHISNLDKKEFFTFLKSMALLVVTQQQELRLLKNQQASGSERSPESSN
jgi:hypothetical protein